MQANDPVAQFIELTLETVFCPACGLTRTQLIGPTWMYQKVGGVLVAICDRCDRNPAARATDLTPGYCRLHYFGENCSGEVKS